MPNVFSQIGSAVASWFSRQRTSLLRVFTTGTHEVYPDINATTAISRGFNANTAVYSIVKKDAKKFGSIPRYVESEAQEGKAEEGLPGALTDLLNRPNPYQGQDAFLTLVRAFYKICGESFIWLNRGDTDTLVDDEFVKIDDLAQGKKPVLEMYVLPPNQVIVVPDPENIFGVYGYILESNVRIPIRAVDMIHWKDINLEFDLVSKPHLRGMSPLTPGNRTLEQNNSATNAAVRMYQNGGAKGALVNETMARMSPRQETQLREVIDGKVNSNDVKNAIAAFEGKWSYLNFGLTSVDMELLKGKDYSMKELCFLFGLPFELFDSETTYQNKEMAQKGWVINEIMPDCKQLDGEMNRVLPKSFGLEGKVSICSDFDSLAELQEDKKTQIEWLMKGPFTVNEVREATGYEESTEEGADEILLPSGLTKLSDLAGDGGEDILTQLYNANGATNTGNGKGQISKNGQGKGVQAGKG